MFFNLFIQEGAGFLDDFLDDLAAGLFFGDHSCALAGHEGSVYYVAFHDGFPEGTKGQVFQFFEGSAFFSSFRYSLVILLRIWRTGCPVLIPVTSESMSLALITFCL